MIEPLRKQSQDGTAYFRDPVIEKSLTALFQIPIDEVARRAKIDDADDPEFVPSECVLHFVRRSKAAGDTQPYRDLFSILRQRILKAVPVRLRKMAGMKRPAKRDSEAQIQEQVLDKFQELLCLDRNVYDERLDYYEIRFASAIKALRITAARKVGKHESQHTQMEYDGKSPSPTLEMQQAIARLKQAKSENEDDFLYRSRFYAAINALPPKLKSVIELHLQERELPIDSKDPEVLTMAKVLMCNEQTVRNRRDQAFARLRDAMKEEEVV